MKKNESSMHCGRYGRAARTLAVATALAVSLAAARPARAERDGNFASDFGVGVGTVFVDLVYMPVKVVYATLGGLTGGFAFLLTGGRFDTAEAIWKPSLGGTYVITPRMLRGEDPIYFSGGSEEEEGHSSEDAPPRRERSSEEPIGERGRSY